jgi:hypothetical protein
MGTWDPTYRVVTCIVEFATHYVGDLVLPSGKVVACDPLLEPNPNSAFIQIIQPGKYRVVLSLAGFKSLQSRGIACAMLQVTQKVPIRYEVAFLDTNYSADYQNYSVDSGTGCFMDAEVARVLKQFREPNPGESIAVAFDRFENEYCQLIINEMQRNIAAAANNDYLYDGKGYWANLCINENTGANVIAFASGDGDGGYVSYWGYDTDGEIACLVTDFALFGSDDEDDEEN